MSAVLSVESPVHRSGPQPPGPERPAPAVTPAHAGVNTVLLSLVPADARRIVEVGCMLGSFAQAARSTRPQVHYVGIDIDPGYAAAAAPHCDRSLAADIESLDDAAYGALFPSDCWIFGDCLEHLRDPWAVLRRLRAAIDPQGTLLTCMPNAQHWSVQRRLLSGAFRYEDTGLLDRTHLRWFTRLTMVELFVATGWRVEQGVALRNHLPGEAETLAAIEQSAQRLGLDAAQAVADALAYQYVFRMRPA